MKKQVKPAKPIATIIDPDQKFVIINGVKLFACHICKEKTFQKAQALGGHMSKAHPNMSPEFTQKQIRRKERTYDRELLNKAKQRFFEHYGYDEKPMRSKINQLKNLILLEEKGLASKKTLKMFKMSKKSNLILQ